MNDLVFVCLNGIVMDYVYIYIYISLYPNGFISPKHGV